MSNEGDAGEDRDNARNLYENSQNMDDEVNSSPSRNYQQQSGRASMVNMTDILDAGSAMEKEKNMRKIKDKMKTLTRTLYNPDSDP